MKDAHLRFGWLTYVKVTEKTTTNIKLRLDRFIGELLPDSPRQAKAHLAHCHAIIVGWSFCGHRFFLGLSRMGHDH